MTATPIRPSSLVGKVIFWSTASFTLIRPAWLAHRVLRWWRTALERVGLLAEPTFLNSVFDTFEFELLTKPRPDQRRPCLCSSGVSVLNLRRDFCTFRQDVSVRI